ncbi:MAG: hypothetical protein D6718_05710 [Acidobacteria bacterium]|nr:MAG: hypothetical protein D6718_05710 [Acidobacteriota bacterium]
MRSLETAVRAGLAGLCLAALIAASAVPASAATRLRFKNGHSIVVVSYEEQGDQIVVTLEDGSTVAFPKILVEKEESGPQIRFQRRGRAVGTGRGPSAHELQGYQAALRQARQQGGRIVAQGGSTQGAGAAAAFGGGLGHAPSGPPQVSVASGRRRGAAKAPGKKPGPQVLTPRMAEGSPEHR